MEDDIRSIQCTPLVTRDGRLPGMLNYRCRWPGGPTADALRYNDLLARMARDGSQALSVAEDMQPEVILMDIGMPGLSGLETCRRLREQPSGRQITIVVPTGLGQASDRAESERAGFDAHLVKPVDFTTLTSVLANAP